MKTQHSQKLKKKFNIFEKSTHKKGLKYLNTKSALSPSGGQLGSPLR